MYGLVTDKSFKVEKTFVYILSIQVSLNGFSFSILSQTEDKLLAFKAEPLKISNPALISRRFEEWVNSEELLKKPFSKIRLIYFSKQFSLLPDQYSQKDVKLKTGEFLFEDSSKQEIAENVIQIFNSKLLFCLPKGFNQVVQDQIGEHTVVHPVKIVLNNLPKINEGIGLVLLFDVNNFYLVLFDDSKVLLTNNFNIANENDALYYVFSTLKQLFVPASQTHLYLSDSQSNLTTYKELFQRYFKEINDLQLMSFSSLKETL